MPKLKTLKRYKNISKMPLCASDTCEAITGFVQFHPFHPDREVRQCLNCGTKSVHALDGSTDTKPRRR